MTDLRADSMTGEQFVFDERTADPDSTEEGERWLRTDLDSGDKIATLRVDVGSSILDVPVFPVGTAEDPVVEAIRVRVGSQTGYIPAVPETNANFPALRLQHNGQVFGYHDEQGVFAFFDVEISSTNSPVNEGSDLNVDYSVVNTGFSANNTQDIRLNIDSTEEDRDTNITLSPSSSTTGTLTWTTPSSSAGTYNASVLSDDDTASTSVTVEAGPAIPDSGDLHARYDWTQASGASSVTDQTGNGYDLSGTYTGPTASINGNQAGEFDGADDFLDVAFGATLSQPTHFFVVINGFENPNNDFAEIVTGDDSTDRQAIAGDNNTADSTNDWVAFAGSRINSGVTYDSNAHILSVLFDGSNSVLRLDGTQIASGDVGANALSGLTVGSHPDQDNHTIVNIGECLLYPTDKSSITTDVESYLSDKWGIAV